MSVTNVDLLVVGGGIAGLATALSLAQQGRSVHLIEQAPEFAEVGAGLQLAPNATRSLARLGLLERIEAQAVAPARLVMMDAVDGTEITSLDLGQRFRARYGAPYLVLHRHDLLSVLLEACRERDEVTLETNRRVVEFRQTDEAMVVACEDGTSYRAKAVIGADGLRSTLRTSVVSDDTRSTGHVAYRGPVPVEHVNGGVKLDSVLVWVGPGLHLVQYPLRHGKLYNQVAVFESDAYSPDHDDWGTPAELAEKFGAMCSHVSASIELLDQSLRWPMYDRAPIDDWTDGRMTLVGDAAHPMLQYLAQGACQALEDAVALGDRLEPGRDVHESFPAYQAARIPQTARVQRSARSWGELWHLRGVAREVRNRYLRGLTPDDFTETDWLYAARDRPLLAGEAAPSQPVVETKGR